MSWKTIEKDGVKTVEIDKDNNPVWINDTDKSEIGVDWKRATQGLLNLRNENKMRREKAEDLENNFNALKEKIDKNDDDDDKNKSKNKGNKGNKDIEARIEAMKTQFTQQLADKDKSMDELLVGNEFAGSVYIKDNLVLPTDIAKTYFGKNFKVKEGKIIGHLNGVEILSQKNPGELAGFNEAMEIMVNSYAGKAAILKGKNQSGGGATGSNNTPADTSKLYVSELSLKDKMTFIKKHGQEEFQKLAEKGKRPSQ